MKCKKGLFKLLLAFSMLLHVQVSSAYNLHQYSNKNGLSNSAVLSICQEQNGMIWIGTCEGLNIFDGTSIHEYTPINRNQTLSGNLINKIIETEKGVIWVETPYGLDRLNTQEQTIQSFREFKDVRLAASQTNDVFILKENGSIYYYQKKEKQVKPLIIQALNPNHILGMTIDNNNRLWLFASNGNTQSYQIERSGDEIKLIPHTIFKNNIELRWAFSDKDQAFFIDDSLSLYEYNFQNQRLYYVFDLADEITKRGDISSIVKSQNDFYIGFKSSGLVKLTYLPDQKNKYQLENIAIQSGIFCLVKDKYQDIIWIGTDGQGLYMYFNDTFTITNTALDTPTYQVNHPVRALFYDEESTLWVGTKGGGILRFPNYIPHTQHSSPFERLFAGNTLLGNNSVYCFAPSRWKRIWIGTENGIDYYSYKEKKIRNFPVTASGKPVRYIHSINEINDSTLWIATVGEGIIKVSFSTDGTNPVVKEAKRIVMNEGRANSNYFFTSYQENDSTIWFGNRGYGAYRLNTLTEEITPYYMENAPSQTINDIFAIHKNSQGYWLGTSAGLLHYQSGKYQLYNDTDIFPSKTIHGILEDQQMNLWLSTNQGLVRFDPTKKNFQIYQQQGMLAVREFSDGAFFKDPCTGTLFFGGTNGFVTISINQYQPKLHSPAIQFTDLSIFGTEYNIHNFMDTHSQPEALTLNYNQNFFCISFNAIDFIHGNNYTYSYKIEELSNHWIKNGKSNQAIFSNLAPGKYTLLVKYKNNITGQESDIQSLIIHITPPWYMTGWAYTGYILLIINIAIWLIFLGIKRYRKKQNAILERLTLQKKEEIYESKLRFFTNITHEFCTPLTLIYGPCEKILSHANTDPYIQKYGQIILQNAKKLNELILELIEFRRLETGHKQLSIIRLSASENIQNMAASFNELAESRNINYQLKITQNIDWNSDLSCLNKIVNNLLSNAFKYTPDNGSIVIELKVEQEQLYISVSNSGKGIAKENLDKIFDRYKILDNFETSSIYSRSGLGLAICHSMTKLLSGNIEVTSIPNEITTFTVTLPNLPLSEEHVEYQPNDLTQNPAFESLSVPGQASLPFDANKQTVMIIDDDTSMLWFISELFADTYNVLSFNNAEDALKQLEIKQPDLIISDVMMPDIDGILFTQKVKENKVWCHIPLILLSARHQSEEQIKGIEAGAEAYITKPFNSNYLKKIVQRLIQREEDLKNYYSSIASSFQLNDGRFLHKEDKQFFDNMMEIINSNIANPNLSVETLSSELKCGVRQFYRKLKQITDKTPADIIREYRLETAKQLLFSSNFSIDEIMDKTGFNNRSTFYKLFSQKFGLPPRQYREENKNQFKEKIQDKNKSQGG